MSMTLLSPAEPRLGVASVIHFAPSRRQSIDLGGLGLLRDRLHVRLDEHVAEHLFRDTEAALEAGHARRVELDLADDVIALEVTLDRVGEAPPAPVVGLRDF